MSAPSPARCPELVSLNGFPLVSPLSSTLSAHCSALQHLFEGFTGTIGLSYFPQPFIVVVLLRLTTRTSHCHMLRPVRGISRFPLMKLMHMPQVSDSGEPNKHSHNALIHVAFPIVLQGQHSRTVISELNTARIKDPGSSGCTPLLTLPHAITGRRGIVRGPAAGGNRYSLLRRGLGSKASPPTSCRF